jgi:hypothetical protein
MRFGQELTSGIPHAIWVNCFLHLIIPAGRFQWQ